MREIAPIGPYRIVGYSFGGAVALEMARQLIDAGEGVELVALLDPALGIDGASRLGEGRAFASRVHERTIDANPGSDLRARIERLREVASAGVDYGSRQLYLASAGIVRRRGLEQHDVFFQLHRRLLRSHRSRPYEGTTIVFGSAQYFESAGAALDGILPPESAGGRRRDVLVASDHGDLVREPGVAEIARALELRHSSEPA
jgi:thioesterase domain-containing protein